jgi:hypothetical protein
LAPCNVPPFKWATTITVSVGLKFEALLKLRKFFKPKWQHSDRSVRLKALSRITDAAVLRRIVEESGR